MNKEQISLELVCQLVAEALECDLASVSSESGLSTHEKWDSLGQIQIILIMEQRYGITVNDTNIEQFTSVKRIYNYLIQEVHP